MQDTFLILWNKGNELKEDTNINAWRYTGLGACVAEITSQNQPVKMKIIGIPDENVINAKPLEIFEYYGLTASNICSQAIALLK